MKTELKIFTILFLVLSLMFIIPLNVGNIYAADTTAPEGKVEVNKEEVKSACNIVPPLDVKGSLILSIVFLCIPGILEKAKEWENIKCEEVVCSYEAVVNSLDPSFCKKDAGYKTCKFIVGEVFALPPMNILESLRDFVAGILADPGTYLVGVAMAYMKWDVSTCMKVGCNSMVVGVEAIIVGLSDIVGAALTIQEIIDEGFSFGDDGEDYCGQMEDYVEELEKITSELK